MVVVVVTEEFDSPVGRDHVVGGNWILNFSTSSLNFN